MCSRAAILIERELRWFNDNPPSGIEVKLAQENLFHWQVTLCGPKDTSWEGGIFQLELIFDEEYNESPPEVYFLTVPFHPNIDIRSGRPCSDLLDQPDSWNPNIRIHTVLESLQNLLADPNLDDPVNVAAAEVFRKSPRLYEQLIRDCVVSSRRVYAGLAPFTDDDTKDDSSTPSIVVTPLGVKFTPFFCAEPEIVSKQLDIRRIPFTDYYEEWKSIATSLPPCGDTKYARPEEMFFNSRSVRAKTTIDEFRSILERQQNLWYGNIPNIQDSLESRHARDRKTLQERAEAQLAALAEQQIRERLGRAPVEIAHASLKGSATTRSGGASRPSISVRSSAKKIKNASRTEKASQPALPELHPPGTSRSIEQSEVLGKISRGPTTEDFLDHNYGSRESERNLKQLGEEVSGVVHEPGDQVWEEDAEQLVKWSAQMTEESFHENVLKDVIIVENSNDDE